MKTTNEQMVASQTAIAEWLDRKFANVELPFALQHNLHEIEFALVPFYNMRNSYQTTYCEMDEEGKPVPGDVPDTLKLVVETAQEYHEKMFKLLTLEVNVEIRMLQLEWFKELEGGVSPRELYPLNWMIEASE